MAEAVSTDAASGAAAKESKGKHKAPKIELSGAQKAAAVIVALGAEKASLLYKYMEPDDVEQITLEVARLGYLDSEVTEDVLTEFYQMCMTNKAVTEGGLEYARTVLEKAYGEQAAEDLASAIVPAEREGQGSHWVNSARGLFSSVAYYVSTSPDCPDCCRNMATVCRVINEGTEAEGADPAAPLKALLRSLPHDHPSRIFGSQFLSSGGNEMRSVLSTLKVNLRIYASGPIAWLTSGDDIDARRVLTEKTALFLHVMDEGSPYNRLFEVLFDQLYKAVYAIADSNGGKVPRRLTILGDEWGNLGAVKCLPALLSLGRSYGLSWCGSVQNISQLNKYGERDGRRKILANCSVKVFLKLGEEEDRRYASELVGKTTRHTMGTSASRGASSSSTTSYSEHADDLIHPWEWTEMSPDKDGVIVVKTAENGVGREHAGCFRAPVCDCTRMPTKEHFDLGTREHEAAKRMEYQARLISRQMGREDGVDLWTPEFEGDAAEPPVADGWSGLFVD